MIAVKGRRNVSVEEFERSLNLVCVLLTESRHRLVISLRSASFFFILMHMQVLKLAVLSLHVSKVISKCQIFSQDANERGTSCDGGYTCLKVRLFWALSLYSISFSTASQVN